MDEFFSFLSFSYLFPFLLRYLSGCRKFLFESYSYFPFVRLADLFARLRNASNVFFSHKLISPFI